MQAWPLPPLPAGWTSSDQPPFVAREPELQAVLSAFSGVLEGSLRGIFIGGAPGIGKTRLISESAGRLRQRGAAVFAGSCVAEFGAPLEPLGGPLLGLLDVIGPAGADDHSRALIRETVEADTARPGRGTDQSELDATGDVGSRLAVAIVRLLRDAAAVHPIVLTLDDLHWADLTMLRLLPALVSGLAGSRVLILAGARSTDPDRSAFADDVLAELSRFESVRRIELSPLTAAQVVDYVAARGPSPALGIHRVARRLGYLTGGNPFLLREAWRQVADADEASMAIVLSETVNDLLRARLGSTTSRERRTLEAAAILGMDVRPDELAAFTGESQASTLGVLDSAVAAGLIEHTPGVGGGTLRFPHAIARQSLLDRIPAADLPVLHARAATTLHDLSPAPPRIIQRLAHHYGNAIELGYREQAVEYLARAGESASAVGAYEDAARRYERAAEVSGTSENSNDLLLAAIRNWRLTAHFSRARELAAQVCQSAGSVRHRLLAATEFEEATWRPGLDGERARELLSAALESDTRPELDAERMVAQAALARATAMAGHPEQASRLAAEVTERARRSGDVELLLRVLRRAYVPSLRPAHLPSAYASAQEFSTLGRQQSARIGEDLHAGPQFCAAAAYVLGDRRGLEEAEEVLVSAAERYGNYWRFWQESRSYLRHFITGDLDAARKASRRAAEAEAAFLSDSRSNVPAQQTYMIKRELGELEVVRPLITGDESPHQQWGPGLLGLYTELGLTTSIKRLLGWLLEHDREEAHESAEWPGVLALMTEAALALDDRDALRRLRPWLAEYRGMHLMVGYFVTTFGAADLYLAQADAALRAGDPEELFGSALELVERFDAALHVAHTRAATARWLRLRDPRSREAAGLERLVRPEATAAGWVRVLSVLDARAAGKGRADGLTAREIEILRLLDEGLSNQGIATRLFISSHTAANHVRNILQKTASSNRSQAVRYARDGGLI